MIAAKKILIVVPVPYSRGSNYLESNCASISGCTGLLKNDDCRVTTLSASKVNRFSPSACAILQQVVATLKSGNIELIIINSVTAAADVCAFM